MNRKYPPGKRYYANHHVPGEVREYRTDRLVCLIPGEPMNNDRQQDRDATLVARALNKAERTNQP